MCTFLLAPVKMRRSCRAYPYPGRAVRTVRRPRVGSRSVRIGLLTGGGDCPGLNAVIRAVVRKGIDTYGDQLVGFRDGWRGVLDDVQEELSIESTRGILPRGGTIQGSSRTNPTRRQDGIARVRENLA